MNFQMLPKELNNIIYKYNHQLLMKDVCEEMKNLFEKNKKVCSHCNKHKFHINWIPCYNCEEETICPACSTKFTHCNEGIIDVPLCHYCDEGLSYN